MRQRSVVQVARDSSPNPIREITRRASPVSSCSSSRRADRAKTTEYSGTPPPSSSAQHAFLYALKRLSRLGSALLDYGLPREAVFSKAQTTEALAQAKRLVEVAGDPFPVGFRAREVIASCSSWRRSRSCTPRVERAAVNAPVMPQGRASAEK